MSAKYDRIGDTYDTTRRPDPTVVSLLLRCLELRPEGAYLDIGCGTGNYTVELQRWGGLWAGVEPSTQMLDLACQKNASIDWRQGGAEDLPFDDQSFDGAITTFAIHHFTDLGKACHEVDRLLRPSGKWIIATATPEQVRAFWLTHYFPNMMAKDAVLMPSIERLENELKPTGLRIARIEPFFITNETEDFFFFSGKYRPEMYLSEDIRNSMSPFRTSITDTELQAGLAALEADIDRGGINKVIQDSSNDLGEYTFIVLEKEAL